MRHVVDRLAAYGEGGLSPAEATRVERHLAGCATCRAELERVVAGLAEAQALQAIQPMPPEVAARIRRALAHTAAGDTAVPVDRPRGPRWRRVAAAAAVVLLAGGFVFWQALTPGVEVVAATSLLPFERLALRTHRAISSGEPLEIASASARDVQRWSRDALELEVPLPLERPPQDGIALLGARRAAGGTVIALAVRFLLDGTPVTLLTTHERAVRGVPRWSPFGKRVRAQPAGRDRVLTWTNTGSVYALVSELPGLGQRACYVCHTDEARRRLIDGLSGRSLVVGHWSLARVR